MAIPRVAYFIPLFSIWAAVSIFYFAHRNGTIPLLQQIAAAGVLPNGEKLNKMTGVPFLDEILANLIPFFELIVDGRTPGLSLHALNFAGAVAALWILLCLESARPGNQGRWIVFSSVFGMLCQVGSFGVFAPVYVALHMFTSPTVDKPTRDNVIINSATILPTSILFGVTTGLILPTVFVALSGMIGTLFPFRQAAIAIWQLWPIYVSLAQIAGGKFASLVCDSKSLLTEASFLRRARSGLRFLYAFAFSCAAVPHIACWAISLAAWALPSLFNANVAPALTPRLVFENKFPWSNEKPQSLGIGALWVLHWDHLIGAAVMLVWAVSLYGAAHSAKGIHVNPINLALKIVALTAVSGVAGAVVELFWERDELLLEDVKNAKGVKSE